MTDKHRAAWLALKASADFAEMEANEAQVLRDLAVEQALGLIDGPWEAKTVMVDGEPFPIAVRKLADGVSPHPEADPDDDGTLCGGFMP